MLNHPYNKLPQQRRRLFLIVAIVLTLAVEGYLIILNSALSGPYAPGGIVAFELAKTAPAAEAILHNWGNAGIDTARRSLQWDFLFLLLYPLAISLACARVAEQWMGWRNLFQMTGYLLAWGQFVAGALDALENLILLSMLDQDFGIALPYLAWIAASLKFMLVGAGLLYVLAGLIRRLRGHWNWILAYLYFERVPLAGSLMLVALAYLGVAGPATTRNLLITDRWHQLLILSYLVFLAAYLCSFTGMLIWRLGRYRFGVRRIGYQRLRKYRRSLQTVPFWVLVLPMLLALFKRTLLGSGAAAAMILLGGLLGWLSLQVIELLREKIVDWYRLHRSGPNAVQKLAQTLGSGYYNANTGQAHRGHAMALVTMGFLGIIYLAGYWQLNPKSPLFEVPPFAYVLGLHMILTSLLSGATFFIDRYRIPLLTAITLYSALVYNTTRTDHYFSLYREVLPAPAIAEAVSARLALADSSADSSGKGIVTLVCASGGGIQAAAWTARVLTGLQESIGPAFPRSIQLISATSGGSVGTLYYLAAFDPHRGLPTRPELLPEVIDAASASSLEASAWGIIYPDLLRIVFPFIDMDLDRAWALEQAWRRQLKPLWAQADPQKPETRLPMLSDWMRRAGQGVLPGVVLNATVVESGQQLALSTVDYPASDSSTTILFDRTFHRVYGDSADLSMVSAARLSATFPYVTPVARARYAGGGEGPLLPSWHIADGGYFDNQGVMAAVEWVQAVLKTPGLRARIGKILILQIMAFPDHQQMPSPENGNGWLSALIGPVQGIVNVRTSTQVARSELELQLLKDAYPGKIETVTLSPAEGDPPLSWHLSQNDIAQLRAAWVQLGDGTGVARIREMFNPAETK